MKKVRFYKMPLGADVEFIYTKNGKVIESKKVVGTGIDVGRNSRIITDGVQGELTPAASTCRESLAGNISACIKSIKHEVKFDPSVEVDQETFDTISDESKVFGCKPSYDAYLGKETKIEIDGKDTRQRTCGGHIHIGNLGITVKYTPKTRTLEPECATCFQRDIDGCARYTSDTTYDNISLDDKDISIHDIEENPAFMTPEAFENFKKVVLHGANAEVDEVKIELNSLVKALKNFKLTIPLMDLFCGIPSVLIDRSPDAAIRRKLYGKAGDFRKPKYGLEYRSLSNFWVKSPALVSLFTGLARHAVLYAAASIENPEMVEAIYSNVTMKEVAEAINQNDYEKAKEIFLKTYKFIIGSVPTGHRSSYPLFDEGAVNFFKYFVVNFDKYNVDIFKAWSNSTSGWFSFTENNMQYVPENIDELFENFKPEVK